MSIGAVWRNSLLYFRLDFVWFINRMKSDYFIHSKICFDSQINETPHLGRDGRKIKLKNRLTFCRWDKQLMSLIKCDWLGRYWNSYRRWNDQSERQGEEGPTTPTCLLAQLKGSRMCCLVASELPDAYSLMTQLGNISLWQIRAKDGRNSSGLLWEMVSVVERGEGFVRILSIADAACFSI